MTKDSKRLIDKRIHKHTVNCLVEWSDHGHGCNNKAAIKSAEKLIAFIEGIVEDEFEAGANALAASRSLQ